MGKEDPEGVNSGMGRKRHSPDLFGVLLFDDDDDDAEWEEEGGEASVFKLGGVWLRIVREEGHRGRGRCHKNGEITNRLINTGADMCNAALSYESYGSSCCTLSSSPYVPSCTSPPISAGNARTSVCGRRACARLSRVFCFSSSSHRERARRIRVSPSAVVE